MRNGRFHGKLMKNLKGEIHMKLCQILKNGSPALGICTDAGVIDVAAEAAARDI